VGQRKDLLDDLMERIRGLEQADRNSQWTSAVSSGFAALDRLLPARGLLGGTLVEWLSEGVGTGGMTLALAVAGRLTRTEGNLVIVDAERTFFPPAAAGLGVPLERTVVVQPGDERSQWWALEQALLCGAVTATVGRLDSANERVLRRLLLAAQKGGGLGFLLRPAAHARIAFCPGIRFFVGQAFQPDQKDSQPGKADLRAGWRLQVELLACRGGVAGGKAVVELGDESNDVSVAAELAGAAAAQRKA
jgi:hypothetical protein